MIETQRLKLHPFTEAHIDAILANDLKTLGSLLGTFPPEAWTTFEGASEAIAFFYDMIRKLKGDLRFGSYFIVLKNEKKLIGTAGFKGMEDFPHSVEIGYEIHPYYQQRGFASETALALVEFAKQHSVKNMIAHTLPEENPSGLVLRKCGLEKVGEVIDPNEGRVWKWTKKLT